MYWQLAANNVDLEGGVKWLDFCIHANDNTLT